MRGAVNLSKVEKGQDIKMAGPGAGSGIAGGKSRKKTQFAMDVDEHAEENRDSEQMEAHGEEVEEEPDFPEVQLDELLENFDEMTLGESEPQEV